MFGPNLAACQLATWTENAVKFKFKLSKKWKRKRNKNEVGMELETKVGSFIPIFHYFAVFLQIFSKLLTHVCNLFFGFCYCLNAHYT